MGGLAPSDDTGSSSTAPPPAPSIGDSQVLQACARALLRAINALDLAPVTEWGRHHPQLQDESAVEFLDRLAAYKVVQVVWARCRLEQTGQKPARLLGRSALRLALPEAAAKL